MKTLSFLSVVNPNNPNLRGVVITLCVRLIVIPIYCGTYNDVDMNIIFYFYGTFMVNYDN